MENLPFLYPKQRTSIFLRVDFRAAFPYAAAAYGHPMPILQASIKDMRQSEGRRARRQPFKTNMKTMMRKVQDLVKSGKTSDAEKTLSAAFKSIDLATKRKIIHWKTAAKKKSSLSRLVSPKK